MTTRNHEEIDKMKIKDKEKIKKMEDSESGKNLESFIPKSYHIGNWKHSNIGKFNLL